MNKLSKIIAEIWNRANRVFPRITGARILRFLIHSDDSFILEETDVDSFRVPYPAKWAPDTGQDPGVNAHWVGGKWGSGVAGTGDVSSSDYILAAHWNRLIGEFKTHNHDGIHGKQLINDSIENYSLTYDVFAGGPASVFLQPVSSYTCGSASVLLSLDPEASHIPNPTASLYHPGTVFFGYQPPWTITYGDLEFHVFYGAPETASGTINFTVKAYRNGTVAWSDSLSVDSSSLSSQAAKVSGSLSYPDFDNYWLAGDFWFTVERDSDSCTDPLLIHGVLVEFNVRP